MGLDASQKGYGFCIIRISAAHTAGAHVITARAAAAVTTAACADTA